MLNIKDEDFDNLIRKAVEDQFIKFEPDHWKKMEHKLNMAEVRKTYNRNIRTSAFILSFLWSLVMLWLYLNHDIRSKEMDQQSDAIAGIEKQENIKQSSVTGYSRKGSGLFPEIGRQPDAGTPALLQPENPAESRQHRPPEITAREPDVFSGISALPALDDLKSGNRSSYGSSAAVVRIPGGNQEPAGSLNGRNTIIKRFERMPADIVHSSVLSAPDLFFSDKKQLPPKKAGDKEKNNKVAGLYVSLNAAANLSSVGFSKMAPPGFDGGVTFEYFLGEKVSLVTGALYSTKRYSLDEKGYQTGNNNSYYSETINKVDGRCAVLDIPLNFRYYFISSKKHQFFLSSGMSSYLMLNEEYDLYATDYYGEETKKTKKLSNENRHIFGIVNFSFGYERVLSPQFSLQVAPFVKMPVTDIGDYRIGLTSAGAFFSLKYRLR